MTGVEKIILTSACTIIGGTVIYVSGQIITKFIIDPIHKQREVIGEIIDALDYYANVYTGTSRSKEEKLKEASTKFRQLATMLKAKTHLIPRYIFLSRLGFVHKYKDMFEVCDELVGLSNSCHKTDSSMSAETEHGSKHARRIRVILGIP